MHSSCSLVSLSNVLVMMSDDLVTITTMAGYLQINFPIGVLEVGILDRLVRQIYHKTSGSCDHVNVRVSNDST